MSKDYFVAERVDMRTLPPDEARLILGSPIYDLLRERGADVGHYRVKSVNRNTQTIELEWIPA